MNNKKIYFAKINENAIIPEKNEEDAGYDFNACFPEEQIIIHPNEIYLVPTGIATAFDRSYALIIKERSSTGAKCMSVRMGVVDSGYRGEIKIGINNTSNKTIIITKNVENNDDNIYHPYTKAIAQGVLVKIPKLQSVEVSYEELLKFHSERKTSYLGASGK